MYMRVCVCERVRVCLHLVPTEALSATATDETLNAIKLFGPGSASNIMSLTPPACLLLSKEAINEY